MGDLNIGFLETMVFCTLGQMSLRVLLCALGTLKVHSHCIITFNYLAKVLRPFPLIVNIYKGNFFFIHITESSPAFLVIYSAYKLNKQGDNIQP